VTTRWTGILHITFVLQLASYGTARSLPDHSNAIVRTANKQSTGLARVRADLHRNLDGKGGGFIVHWSFTSSRFILVIDKRYYEQNKLLAATMTTRVCFDSNGVHLPKTLIIQDASGTELARGPFQNVPALYQ